MTATHWNPHDVTLTLLRVKAPNSITREPQNWPRWAALLPHVLAVTSHIDNTVISTSVPAASHTSWLLDRAATYLQVHARLNEARPLMDRALRIDEVVYGSDHPEVAVRLSNLATIVLDLGDSAAARPLMERGLGTAEDVHGSDHPTVAICLSNLAMILQDLGDPAAARPLMERALRIHEVVYGPDHPEVATDLSNLAMILQDLGDPAAARPLMERALRIAEAVYGPDHPNVTSGRRFLRRLTMLTASEEPEDDDE